MYVDFGYVRASMEQFPEAAGLFERAVKADPKCIDAYVGLAKVRSSMGHPDQAVEAVRKGLKHHPKSAALWNELGVAYTKMEKWREAADALQKAVKYDSEEELYRSNLAGVLVVAGDLDRAYRLYSEQMTAADAHCQIARILGGQGRMQECQKHVQLALRSDPGHAVARTLQSQLSDPQLRTVGYRGAADENARPTPPSAASF
jgi:Flp pilus assembly protein TadD